MSSDVTNTNDRGPGSLRAAVADGAPVTFSISNADIFLHTPLLTPRTIDATGAGGIRIWGQPVRASADNVTLRQLALLPGDWHAAAGNGRPGRGLGNLIGSAADGVQASGLTGIEIDHCTVLWSMDELLDIYNSDVTVRNSLFADALNDNHHETTGLHSMGALVSMTTTNRTVKLYNNVLAHTLARNIGLGLDPTGKLTLSLYGNLFYNSGTHALHTTAGGMTNADIDAVGNCWRDGPDTAWGAFAWLGIKDIDLYQSGNTRELANDTTVDPWATEAQLSGQLTAAQHDGSPDAILSRSELLATIGANENRFWRDTQIIDEITNRTGRIRDDLADLAGYFPTALRYAPNITSGLRHRWRFDDDIADSAGSADLTATGTPAYEAGPFGQGVVVESSEILSATDPATADFGADDSFGLAGWIKYPTNPGFTNFPIFKKTDVNADNAGWLVNTNPTGANARPGLIICDGTRRAIWLGDTTTVITPDTWHHVAFTFNRLAGIGAVFVDGVVVDASAFLDGAGSPTSLDDIGDLDNALDVIFNRASVATETWYDDWRIYKGRALLIQDVVELMQAAGSVERLRRRRRAATRA